MSMQEPELNHDFLDAGVDLHALDSISFDGKATVLDRLGPAHFRSKGFSFMGFLQTVYDHVAEHTTQTPIGNMPPPTDEPDAPDADNSTAAEPDVEAESGSSVEDDSFPPASRDDG